MAKLAKSDWHGCPTRYAAGAIGDKWCFLLMRDVLLHGKRTYSEFAAGPEGISTNILADRLSRLEEDGFLTRRTDPRKGSRVCYFPTRKLRDLLPALLSLMVWAVKYDPQTEAPPSFATGFQADPAAAIRWYEAEIDRIDTEILGPQPV